MGKIARGAYIGCHKSADYPYWNYVPNNFQFLPHTCTETCVCTDLGCSHHWEWKDGNPPEKQSIRKILGLFGAFRNKPDSQDAFSRNFERIVTLVKPLQRKTVLCNWDARDVACVYDAARTYLQDQVVNTISTVLTTKTLHFLIPDLFVILDRKQVFKPFREDMRTPNGNSSLAGGIDKVDGRKYVTLLDHVRNEVTAAMKGKVAYTVNGGIAKGWIASAKDFRLVSPLWVGEKQFPNTFCKVVDHIMSDRVIYG